LTDLNAAMSSTNKLSVD